MDSLTFHLLIWRKSGARGGRKTCFPGRPGFSDAGVHIIGGGTKGFAVEYSGAFTCTSASRPIQDANLLLVQRCRILAGIRTCGLAA
jgi:hypothetical protein